jgi:hypothetical protein
MVASVLATILMSLDSMINYSTGTRGIFFESRAPTAVRLVEHPKASLSIYFIFFFNASKIILPSICLVNTSII